MNSQKLENILNLSLDSTQEERELSRTLNAVSYTHLDVYKRQQHRS